MAQYNFNDLIDKYMGFSIPEYQIKINGSEFNKDQKFTITDFNVELTAGYEASVCQFVINDGVNLDDFQKGHYKVDEEIEKNVQLGNTIEVFLGYRTGTDKSKLELVFKGYIATLEFQYHNETGFSIHVECMDVKGLMMNNFRSRLIKNDLKNYKNVVEDVLSAYGKLIDKQNIATADEATVQIEQHSQSDYEFVVNLAKILNFSFYVVKGEVFFQPVAKDTTVLLEMDTGNLLGFRREITLAGQVSEVTVRVNNEQDPNKPFESTANSFKTIGKGSKGSKDIKLLANKNFKKTIIDPRVGSEKEAQVRAEAELAKGALGFVQANFECVGIPELVPGKMLEISGFGTGYDNQYYIKKIIHKFSKTDYITSGNLGVNKI